MDVLRVLAPGLLTTVQDAGRPGLRRLGVPTGGAADIPALRLANLLAGNPPDAAGLEITQRGPTLEVDAGDELRVAVAGECEIHVEDGRGGARPVAPWASLTLRPGDRLRLGTVRAGLRCHLAVAGGIAVPPVLGSAATDLRGGWGGLEGRALRAGDALPLSPIRPGGGAEVELAAPPWWAPGAPVRAVPGPQDDHFAAAVLDRLAAAEWTVTPASDRTGLRLDGPELEHLGDAEIVSDACLPGSVQVPGSRRPIVLLVDGGTTGGYPKIATVASADTGALGRLRPGARLRFELVDVTTAARLRRELEAWFAATAAEVAGARTGAP
ncbi:MAG TPA: biotin-dependent carboxyltransferase family protein [Candidatus Dormibacteraeota bacterium]|nr:biotin-dependent carboxyltransferase family protein [Candidatus Dormibacteraeota bacterium]